MPQLKTANNSERGTRYCSTLMYVCFCVCHSLTADSVTTHPVFLTHLYQSCNLAHWTFKLLDVTSKGIGEEKHYLLLIITSPTSVKPVFASLPPLYSTCYFFLVIFFLSFFFWMGAPFRSIQTFIGIYFSFCTMLPPKNVFPLRWAFKRWNHNEIIE